VFYPKDSGKDAGAPGAQPSGDKPDKKKKAAQ
jgi:hypothetical protein